MITIIKRKKEIALALALLFLVLNFLFLIWYIFFGYQVEFHSDSAHKVLLAREIIETGNYFPRDWNYVNKDLFVWYGQLFILPLLAFIPAGYLAHAVAGAISSIIFLFGIWLVSSLTQVSIVRRLFVVAIFASGISVLMAENLYGQTVYGTFSYFSFYIIFLSYKFLTSERKKQLYIGSALFLIILLSFWGNPQRAFVFYGLPLFCAILWFWFNAVQNQPSNGKLSVFRIFPIIFLGIAFGLVLSNYTLATVNNIPGAGTAKWLSYDLMLRNISLFPKGFLALFGGLPREDGVLASTIGIYEVGRFVAALVMLLLIPIVVWYAIQEKRLGASFFAIYAVTAFAGVLFLQASTTIPDMSDPIASFRYFVPSLVLLVVLVLTSPLNFRMHPIIFVAMLFASLMILTSGISSFGVNNRFLNEGWLAATYPRNHLNDLKNFLLSNGLKYGYASYWNAGLLSVLSDEKLLVRQVVFERGLPLPMRHLSSNRWYKSSAWQGETFLLISNPEMKDFDLEKIEIYLGKPTRKLVHGDFNIFVFSKNVANGGIPKWEMRFENPVTFSVNKYSNSQVGMFVENYKDDDSALVADRGKVGALHYGPYIQVDPGDYTVTFEVYSNEAPDETLRLDVAGDNRILAEKSLRRSDGLQYLSFAITKPTVLEFRVWVSGREKVIFKGFSIVRKPNN